MVEDLTPELFEAVLPKTARSAVTKSMMTDINTLIKSEHEREQFKDNLLDFSNILTEGKFKLESYVGAVKYVTFVLLGSQNNVAYAKAFPDKYQKWILENTPNKTIASYVSAFNKSKLVYKMFEQAMVPTHILNANKFQQAINKQAEIMNDDRASFKVQSDAANSLLTHLKAPETKKIEIDIGTGQSDQLADLRAITEEHTKQLQQQLRNGVSAKTIAHASIIPQEKVINP